MKKGLLVFSCIFLLIGFIIKAPNSGAFEQYKEGCKNCHLLFVSGYSAKPRNQWLTTSGKHGGHLDMLNDNQMGCDL